MGLFNGKKNQPNVRDPRPKGAQKGVAKRVHQNGVFNVGSKARTPWLFSGKGTDKFTGGKTPRWKNK